jgi:predicted outer membrane repeat protein
MFQFTSARNASFVNAAGVRGLFVGIAFFICIAFNQSINAANYTVTNTLDSGAGSLRQAVLDANGTPANDVINFNIPSAAAGCVTATGVCTITLSSEIIVDVAGGALSINGTGANRLTIDGGAGTNRIFYSNGATFTLRGATLTGGNSTGASNSTFGGAIYVTGGTLTLSAVLVQNNSSGDRGGAIYITGGSNHLILNSTISGNSAAAPGGGIYTDSGTLFVTNTTITGNSATGGGNQAGGVFIGGGSATFRNSTVTNNSASAAGGIQASATVNLGNTIVAGNNAPNFPEILSFGGAVSAGYNLIGDNGGDSTNTNVGIVYQSTDIQNTPPLLDALANYGGTVPTMRLQPTSPAIDKGSAVAGVFSDERGVIRPFDNPSIVNGFTNFSEAVKLDDFSPFGVISGNGADIGAFELQTSIVKDWGYNSNGQLGLGNITNPQMTPQTLSGFSDITQFGGGYFHSVALRSDGTVVTAGDDQFGQLGDGTIGGGNRLTFGQVVVAAGGANLSGIVHVSGGYYHSVALKSDGTVWAWGRNSFGQLGNGMSGSGTESAIPVQVGAGIAAFNTHVVAVSAGSYHNLALTDDGKVWAWGYNSNGQLGDGTIVNSNVPIPVKVSSGGAQLAGIEQISAGEIHSVALTTTGAVLVWGNNGEGELGANTSGGNVPYPTQTSNFLMGTIVQISAGTYHNVAVNTLGDVYAWGYGGFGAIGDNNTADALVPRKTSTVANVVRIEAHDAYHTLARQRDGTMFVWGYNTNGEIGNGTTTNQLTPLNISATAGTGGNLGTNIAVFGAGRFTSFAATLPQITISAGAGVLRGDNFSVTFPASTVAGTTQIRAFDPTATGLTVPAGYTIEANSTGYDFTSTSTFTGNAQVCLKVTSQINQTAFNRLTILHDDNFDGTLDAVTVTKNYQKREVCRVTTSFSPFVLAQAVAPTAANVSIGGRLIVGKGVGLTNAVVTLIDAQGNTRSTVSSSFGFYSFDNITVGQNVVLYVSSKRYQFETQSLWVTEDVGDLNFNAEQSFGEVRGK